MINPNKYKRLDDAKQKVFDTPTPIPSDHISKYISYKEKLYRDQLKNVEFFEHQPITKYYNHKNHNSHKNHNNILKENPDQLLKDAREIIREACRSNQRIVLLSGAKNDQFLRLAQYQSNAVYTILQNLQFDATIELNYIDGTFKQATLMCNKNFRQFNNSVETQKQFQKQLESNSLELVQTTNRKQYDIGIYDSQKSDPVEELDEESDDSELIHDSESLLFSFKKEEQTFLEQMLYQFFKTSHKESKNKFISQYQFYINDSQQIVVEYTIKGIVDRGINSYLITVRRRLLNQLFNFGNYFSSYKKEEFMEALISQPFFTYKLTKYSHCSFIKNILRHISNNQDQLLMQGKHLEPHQENQWIILAIRPRSFNTSLVYSAYAWLIISNASQQLHFLNHDLLGDYLTENMKMQYQSLKEECDEILDRQVENFNDDCYMDPQYLMKYIKNDSLEEFRQSMNILFYQDEIRDQTILSQNLQQQDEKDSCLSKIEEYNYINQEYQRVCKKVIGELQLLSTQSVIELKEIVNALKRRIRIENQRAIQRLPIYLKKSQILEQIRQKQITLIVGDTGSGKSTQLVQYIAEEIELYGKRVVSTQPRILAVRSVAKRVAEELLSKIGEDVGVTTAIYEVISLRTKIIFTQDRIILNELSKDENLQKYSIIIVDEAHERTINTDLLLGLLKRLLSRRPDLKLIVTSATMDQELFSLYYDQPIFRVPGQMFYVEVRYLELREYDNYIDMVYHVIQQKVIKKILQGEYKRRHVLVFLSGVDDINCLMSRTGSLNIEGLRFLPLHGLLSQEEQFEVFRNEGYVKVIFSTRIAETALTINDITTVIDIGIDRFKYFDQERGLQTTILDQISMSQANQRKGRAGRTGPGICYRLYSERTWDQMAPHKRSEITTLNLDIVVLRLKVFRVSELNRFDYLEKPSDEALRVSQEYLLSIRALQNMENGVIITNLGMMMAQLSTEPRISRILIEAFYRGVFDDVLSIISILLNSKYLFIRGSLQDAQEQNIWNKLYFIHPSGDLLTFLNVYNDFQEKEFTYRRDKSLLKQWCQSNSLHYQALKQTKHTSEEIMENFKIWAPELERNNFIERELRVRDRLYFTIEANESHRDDEIMKCFIGAFYPDLCIYNGTPKLGYTMLSKQMNLRIYGSSALATLNEYPKWMICTDMLKSENTGSNYCRVAQEINFELLKKCIPLEFIERYKLDELNQQPYPKYEILQQGFYPNILIEKFMKSDIYRSSGEIYDIRNNQLSVWTLNKEETRDKLLKFFQPIRQRINNQHLSMCFGSNLTCKFMKGAELVEIVDGPQPKINFFDIPIKMVQQILDDNAITYKEIQEDRMKPNRGFIQFHGEDESKYAQTTLKNHCFNSKVYLAMSKQEHNVTTTMIIKFWVQEGNGDATIHFHKDQQGYDQAYKFASNIKDEDFFVDGRQIDEVIVKQNKVHIKCLKPRTDEDCLLSAVEEYCQRNQIGKPLKCMVKRRNLTQQAFVDLAQDWVCRTNIILEEFMTYGQKPPLIIPLFSYFHLQKIIFKIIHIPDFIFADRFRSKIHLSTNIIGCQRAYVTVEYKYTRWILGRTLELNRTNYRDIQESILQSSGGSIRFVLQNQEMRNNDKLVLRIVGQNPLKVQLAGKAMDPIIVGETLKNNQAAALKRAYSMSDEVKQQIEMIWERNCCVLGQMKRESVVYGKTFKNIINCIEELDNFLNHQNSDSSVVDIYLGTYSLRPLIRINDNLLSHLNSIYPNIYASLSVNKRMVYLEGDSSEVQEYKQALLRSLKSQELPNKDLCCRICFSEFDQDVFSLILCNHSFCRGCIYRQIMESEAPILCPQEGCNEKIAIQDLEILTQKSHMKYLLKQSFRRYVQANQDKFTICITPDCEQVFLLGADTSLTCPNCLVSFCPKCKEGSHQGSCALNQLVKKQKKKKAVLTLEQMKILDIKQCPKCQTGIQKDRGCNHMKCEQCKIHFCWMCQFQGVDEALIYDHINQQHNNQLFG